MNLRPPMRNRLRRAFTLIELMVVVLILAVLAALVVPKIVNAGDKAKWNAAVSDIGTIKSCLARFHLDCGRYPTTEEGLNALSERPSGLEGKWDGPYPEKPILQDPWGKPYIYESTGNSAYTISSLGQDGVEGGDLYNADIVESTE